MLFIPLIGFAQLPKEVKHIEIASEVVDTMILVNKPDLDKINTAFYRLEIYEDLNETNEEIISNLQLETNKLKELADKQEIIIDNQKQQLANREKENKELISDLEKQVKRANRKIVFWQITTGLGVVGTILCAIF